MKLNDINRGKPLQTSLILPLSLQETVVLPTLKNIDENERYVGKGYADVHHDVGKNVGRNALGEAFPTPCWYGIGKASLDA
ncbi:hypothetical protein E5676_scaffold142G004250 [Cucumis melo var. makuwa]|uniref:Uncharacterized protein n=1 Tax=Cucumis melo var. makuwa TaxID=1194695 RepID=A0A5D3DI61_CUCMM|nr:hypothetical protein E6C27_scaffold460G00480 [Cucumis melo var. makuwa]TYK23361.1 hypothetical protein E5676_scaffold142G004250 [Cucumis melo var. makuwa]